MKKFKRKHCFIFLVIATFLVLGSMFHTVIAQSSRQCVCHIENEETGEGHVIEVDELAIKGHLRHGDVQCTVNCDEVLDKFCNIATGGKCAPGTD
ncbi:MAG: hypothetical protein ACRD4B_04460 [Acidobacteriota bacterium]